MENNLILQYIPTLLQIMSENEDIITKIQELYTNEKNPQKIRKLIEKHFLPTEREKKENAEVPTPVALVDEMLDKMPKSFWKKTNKVFEPCCGKGNFVLGIFDKFYKGMKSKYEGKEDKLCKKIIRKCLYFGDLEPVNVFITQELLKCHCIMYSENAILYDDDFNSYTGSTLDLDIISEWNIDGFNAVIGNPPYNGNSGNKGKGHTLWNKFVNISINIWIKKNGYLVYVHPSSWRQINNKILEIFKKKQLHYLEIHNVEDGIKTFKCSTRYDWYILENKNKYKNTTIKDEEGKINVINLDDWSFIPNMMFKKIQKIIENNNNHLDINYYRSNYGADKNWVSKIKNREFKYPVVYTINKLNKLSLRYSNTNEKGMFGKSKFIFSNGAGFYCDKNGDYGLTQWAYCIYDNEEILHNIEKAFRNSNFKKIILSIKLDSSNYNIPVMKLFKKDFWKEFI